MGGILDGFFKTNELPLLHHAGSVPAKQAEAIAHQRYEAFDIKRKAAERKAATEADELADLERIAEGAKAVKGKRKIGETSKPGAKPRGRK